MLWTYDEVSEDDCCTSMGAAENTHTHTYSVTPVQLSVNSPCVLHLCTCGD